MTSFIMSEYPEHIALIGCGFTGTSAFFQLVDRYPVRAITIFEASGKFGPGYPYDVDECADYLMNNTNDSLGIVPWNRRAFWNWLQGRRDLVANPEARGHVPRRVFGLFLESVFQATQTLATVKGITVTTVSAEVKHALEDEQGNVHLEWDTGRTVVDAALLTTGRCPDAHLCDPPPSDSPARYVDNHVGNDALDTLPLDAQVHVVGASLSAYDVVNRLFSPTTGARFERRENGTLGFIAGNNRRRVVLCSRTGRLKRMQSRRPSFPKAKHFTLEALRALAPPGCLQLKNVLQLIQKEAQAYGVPFDPSVFGPQYRACENEAQVNTRAGVLLAEGLSAACASPSGNFLVDLFDAAQLTLWDVFAEALLAPEQEDLYRRQYETAALSYAAPCPIPTAERLLALHRSGQLEVMAGVRDVTLAANGSHYRIKHTFGVATATVVVNATGGVDRRVTSMRQSPLIQSLVERRLLRPYQRGGAAKNGAAVDMKTFRAHGARNIYVTNMLLWGPGFFTSSAFMMATVVERALAAMSKSVED